MSPPGPSRRGDASAAGPLNGSCSLLTRPGGLGEIQAVTPNLKEGRPAGTRTARPVAGTDSEARRRAGRGGAAQYPDPWPGPGLPASPGRSRIDGREGLGRGAQPGPGLAVPARAGQGRPFPTRLAGGWLVASWWLPPAWLQASWWLAGGGAPSVLPACCQCAASALPASWVLARC
jgi:hypothetical protein